VQRKPSDGIPAVPVALPRAFSHEEETIVTSGALRIFHRTTSENAGVILRDGFRDGPCSLFHQRIGVVGVCFSPWSVYDENQGAQGDVIFGFDVPSSFAEEYGLFEEWPEINPGGPAIFYELVIPAGVVNTLGPPQLFEWSDDRSRYVPVTRPRT